MSVLKNIVKNADSASVGPEWGLRFCITNKPPSDVLEYQSPYLCCVAQSPRPHVKDSTAKWG